MNNNDIEEDVKIVENYLAEQDRKFVSQYRLRCLQAIENILAKANKYDRLVARIKEVRSSLEKDGFVGYADELKDILEEE